MMDQGATDISRKIQALEERLLQPETRASAGALRSLLAEELVEIGSSGRVYDSRQIVAALADKPPAWNYSLSDFSATLLAPDLTLATYHIRATRPDGSQERCSLRSSIWRLSDGRWQMIFHQGTPTAC